MMRKLIASSVQFRWLALFLAGAVMVVGLVQLQHAQVDVFPEFAPQQVEVQTIAVGNSSTEVEELITAPLEEQLSGIEGVEDLRSKSIADLSSIVLVFKHGVNQERARQLVAERVAQVTPSLPTWAAPPVIIPPVSTTSRIMKIGLTSDTISQMEMSRISYWTIRQRLLRVPGVAQVSIWGEQLQQLHVLVDPKKLKSHQVTLDEVMDTTAEALDAQVLKYTDGSMIGTGGFVEDGRVRLSVRSVQSITSEKELAEVTITRAEGHKGPQTRLGDIGDVVTTHMQMWGDAVVNNGDGVLLVVQKFPGANTLQVTQGLDAALTELAPALTGIKVDSTIFRPASFIELALQNLTISLLIGIGLVVLILIAFLMQWRTTLMSLISIPLSLMAAALVLQTAGVTMNVMVIAGFAVSVGVVVDDAIIDTENIVRRLRGFQGPRTYDNVFTIIVDGSLEVRSAIIYATLIDIVAIVPVFLLQGLSGAFFQPLVLSYGLAVLASMVVATTVTPALCMLLLRSAPLRHGDPWLLRVLKAGYAKVLSPILKTPWPAIAAALTLTVLGSLVAPTLGTSLFPNFKERDFLIIWVSKPGTSLTEEKRVVASACRKLIQVEGVRGCGAHIGQALLADEVFGVNNGEHWVSLDQDADYDETLAAITRIVDEYPGSFREIATYLRERISEVLTGANESVVVRISGSDLVHLHEVAEDVEERIHDVPGMEDVHIDVQQDIPHIQVEVDEKKAAALGLKPGDIRRQAATMVAGEEVGDLFQGGRAYDVHVWSMPAYRNSVTSVKELVIDLPKGGQIQLQDVARVWLGPTPSAITRANGSRFIDVGGNMLEGSDLGAAVAEVKERVAGIHVPSGMAISVIGEADELGKASRGLLVFGGAAAFAIFLLLLSAFGRPRLAVLHFLTLPTALVGGIVAAWLGGGIVSLGSLVGFLTVYGIAARNGILMISHFQHLEKVEGVPFGRALVMQGASERLAPILMTASATGLALVPLVAAGDIAGHEIENPMAMVILGGLVTSTLLNLFVLPSLYLRFAKSRQEVAALPATGNVALPRGEAMLGQLFPRAARSGRGSKA